RSRRFLPAAKRVFSVRGSPARSRVTRARVDSPPEPPPSADARTRSKRLRALGFVHLRTLSHVFDHFSTKAFELPLHAASIFCASQNIIDTAWSKTTPSIRRHRYSGTPRPQSVRVGRTMSPTAP